MEPKDQKEKPLSLEACLLIYDEECRLCMSVKHDLERRGISQTRTGIRFVAYQSEAARTVTVIGHRYRLGRPQTAFLIQPSGKILQALDAFSLLLPHLPGGTLMQWGLRIGRVRQLAGWGHRLIARYRYRWFGVAQPARR